MSDPGISIAVVDAKTPGNVGTIARAMKNFGLSDLYLVDPPELDPDGDAYGFAGQARTDLLPNAKTVSFDYLVENFHTVGTTATTNSDHRRHVRYPYKTPDELRDSLASVATETVVIFGRERVGLHNEELARLDEICSIPASDSYPVLNLGQAATVICYALSPLSIESTQQPDQIVRAPEADIEGLYAEFDRLLGQLGETDDRDRLMRLWRRLLGRAHPTKREVSSLRGVVRRSADRVEPPSRE